jgi:ketosteroid isomerase-like protein
MPDVVVTRVGQSGPPRRSRNLEERLLVRFPWLFRRGAALVQRRFRRRSRLRRALVRRSLVSGWAAFNRLDFELMLVRYSDDIEYVFDPGLQTLGLEGTFRGHEEMVDGLRQLAETWGSLKLEPTYALDLGDRYLFLGFNRSRARASGVQLEQQVAQLVTVREGLVTHDQFFFSWEAGLRAAGLDPEAIALARSDKEGQRVALA